MPRPLSKAACSGSRLVRAGDGPLRFGRISRRALAALALSLTVPLALLTAGAQAAAPAAETPVTVQPAEVATALFVAGDITRLSSPGNGTEELVLEKALQQLYADEPTLAPATAEGYVAEMKTKLAGASAPSQASLQLMAGNQRILAILEALEATSGSPAAALPAPAKLAVTHLAADALSGASNIFANAEVPKYFEPDADARTNLAYTTFAPATVLRATRELAARNPTFGEARDAIWAKVSEESVFSEWRELLDESKVLDSEALKDLREKIEAGDGTITEEPKQLTELFTEGQTATQEQSCGHGGSEEAIGGMSIEGIPRLECSGGALYEDAHARACGEKSKCEAELKNLKSQAAERAEAIAEERAEMVAAAELLRPSDNTAAALQQATAQAQGQITEEETAYADYEAEQAEKEAIAGGIKSGLQAGTAVLALGTGNYSEGVSGLIGVGFELYENIEGALSDPPPGPQQITLEDLADLSTQLAGFQQYTQEAFGAINTQLAQLSSQLARENYELKEDLNELGERLEKEQGTIFALQDEVKELFAAQTKANLQTTIEDSVGWLQLTGEPLAAAKIQEALVALKKDATEIANGPLVNDAETQPYTFEGAGRQLTSKATGEPADLSEDISYLGRFPLEQGWITGTAPASLANTTFWSESARAYAQLMLENASHATAADVAGLKELEKEGVSLDKAAAAWSEPTGGAKTGNAVLDNAIANFEAAVDGAGVDGTSSIETLLDEAAETSFETSLEKHVKTASPLGNPTELKLWGGAEQKFSASTVAAAEYPALKWEECAGSSGTSGKEQMPEQFIASLPAALVDGVRLGIVGAPGSGDPLILTACRSIAKHVVPGKTEKAEFREGCKGLLKSTCELVFQESTVQESEPETVTETLTLKEGEGGHTLTSVAAGECQQTALFWTGAGHSESVDPEDGELDGDVDGKTAQGPPFEGRHVGTVSNLSVNASEVSWSEDTQAVFEGAACPHVGSEEKAGIEYADYSASENPLGSTEPAIVEKADEKLRELQESAYDEGRSALENPAKGNPEESLAGARALVQSYVKLGFPQAVDSDLALQSDVEGLGAQFLDPEPGTPRPLPAQLNALAVSWVHRLEHAGKPGQPKLEQLVEEDQIDEVRTRSTKWAEEIVEQLKPYVEGKVKGFAEGSAEEAVSEQSPAIEETLDSLQLTRDVLAESRAPSAETLTPDSDVGISEATVRGEVDPNGGAVESCVFEYGSTESYGHSVACSAIPASTEKAVVVSAAVANWTPEGSFHERVVLKTWGGTSYGQDVRVQLAQSTQAPAGLVMARTDTPEATIGGFTAEELPAGIELPSGAKQIVGSLSFSVNVTPGGTARVDIELPEGSAPTALYKLVTGAGGGKEYKEIPASLYTIKGNVIELTLVDGGPDDEDGTVNGVIVDPLVPVVVSQPAQSPTVTPPAVTPPSAAIAPPALAVAPPTATIGSPAEDSVYTVGAVVKTKFDCTEAPGGPGIASCTDSAGASGGAGKLETAKLGLYTYTVTAKSHDGQSASATIHYAVVARHECVSDQRVTLHVAYHVSLPPGTSLRSSTVLRHGRVMAKLHGPTEVAVLSFAGQHKGPYEVTLVTKLSNGETRRSAVVFHSCVGVPKPVARKR